MNYDIMESYVEKVYRYAIKRTYNRGSRAAPGLKSTYKMRKLKQVNN